MKLTATLSHNHGHRRAMARDRALELELESRPVGVQLFWAFHFIHVPHVLVETTTRETEATEIICLPAQIVGKCRQINLQLTNSKSDRGRPTERKRVRERHNSRWCYGIIKHLFLAGNGSWRTYIPPRSSRDPLGIPSSVRIWAVLAPPSWFW